MQPHLPITFPFAEFIINPQTSWKRFVNPQFFFTYNLGDAAIENHVLSRAGSYGKQLGKILDVVDVLVRHLPADALTAGERRTVDEFIELRDDVERAKGEFREDEGGVGSGVNVDRFLSSLDRLRNTDPRAYAAAVRRLRDGLADDDDTT
jgi:hypothetical protein